MEPDLPRCPHCGRVPFERRPQHSLHLALCLKEGDDPCQAVAAKIERAKAMGDAVIPLLHKEIAFLSRRLDAGLRGLDPHVYTIHGIRLIVNAVHADRFAHWMYLRDRFERATCALAALRPRT